MSTRRPPRTLTPQFKVQIVLEALKEEKTLAEIAREYDIHPQLISQWKRQFLCLAPKIFESKSRREQTRESRKMEELEKIIGRQAIEIQFLKKVLGHLG